MKFARYQKMLKVRLLIYFLLLAYIAVTFAKGIAPTNRVHPFIYILVAVCVFGVAFFHIYMTGYHLRVKDEGIYKVWGFLGLTFHKKLIVSFEKLFIQLEDGTIRFFTLESSGVVHASYSFGRIERGMQTIGDLSFIPIYDFVKFIREVFSKVKGAQIDRASKEIAIKEGAQVDGKIEIIERG